MKKLRWLSAGGLALMLGIGAGCGKKADPKQSSAAQEPTTVESKAASKPTEPASVSTAKISGAQEVMAAVDRKDYDGAIAALLRIRQSVATADQQLQFATLADEVRIKLLEAAPTQPKAAEALSVLRKITGGR